MISTAHARKVASFFIFLHKLSSKKKINHELRLKMAKVATKGILPRTHDFFLLFINDFQQMLCDVVNFCGKLLVNSRAEPT